MAELRIRIRQPNDSGKYWQTKIEGDVVISGVVTLHGNRNAKDPVHDALSKFMKTQLKRTTSGWRRSSHGTYMSFPNGDYQVVLNIGGCFLALGRTNNRLSLNGKTESLNTIASALARLVFKSVTEKDAGKLMKSLYASLSLPEDVKYCLENRVPYHFFDNFNKVSVRLNCQQIGDNEIAIEVADGVWGTLTAKELESFCSFYLHNHRRSKKWAFTSPEILYERTMGVTPKVSDVKVMKEFMKQNRQQDIVEKRARELVKEVEQRYPDRIKVDWNSKGEPDAMYIRGKGWDWKITDNQYKSDIQAVSTFVWNTNQNDSEFAQAELKWIDSHNETVEHNREVLMNAGYEIFDDVIDKKSYLKQGGEGLTDQVLGQLRTVPQKPTNELRWKGPICIDNMSAGSSVGDQFVARALALLNDTMTVALVSTIKSYIKTNENEGRNENEMCGMRKSDI